MHGSSVVRCPTLRWGREITPVSKGPVTWLAMYGRSDLHKVVLILSVLARIDFSALKRAVLSLTFEWKKYPHARLSAFGTHNTHWRMSEDHKHLHRSAMNGQWSKGSFANRWSKCFGRLYIRNVERFVSNFIYAHLFAQCKGVQQVKSHSDKPQ